MQTTSVDYRDSFNRENEVSFLRKMTSFQPKIRAIFETSARKQAVKNAYKTYCKKVYHYINMVIDDERIAQELAHKTCLEMWSLRKTYVSTIDLFTMAQHVALQHGYKLLSANNPTRRASTQAEPNSLTRKIRDLSNQDRSVIYFVLTEAMSYDDIAKVAHLEADTVEKAYLSAIDILKKECR